MNLTILIVSHFTEPFGGISTNYGFLIRSSLAQKFNLFSVESSQGNLSFTERGKFSFHTVLNAQYNLYKFIKALHQTKPHIVHIGSAHGWSFLKHSLMSFYAKCYGYKVVMQVHASIFKAIPLDSRLWRNYVLFILKQADGIVTLSREWDALLEILPNAKICYVPNAIDVTPYQALPRPRPNFDQGLRLLFFGHIGREKGCFDLLDALEWVRQRTNANFRMDFVGETLRVGEKELISEQIKARNLSDFVAVHEPEYSDAKMQRLANSDILILPSYHEGMPMSVIEAMAAGMAVIGSQVGGIPDQIIPGETGLLVPPGDVSALGAAILQLVEHPQTVLQMGQAGRKRAVEVFDIETKAQTLENFYRKLLVKN